VEGRLGALEEPKQTIKFDKRSTAVDRTRTSGGCSVDRRSRLSPWAGADRMAPNIAIPSTLLP
jgi:hypothetical protein